MWIASDSDTKIILVAAIHVLPSQTQWHSDALDKAIRSADELIVDTKVSDSQAVRAAFAKHAFRTDLPPIKDRLQSNLELALLSASQQARVPITTLDKMKTWAVSFLVMGSRRSTCQPGISLKLENEFDHARRKVTALQTPEISFADFDALPETAQLELLEQSLKPARQETYHSMILAWAAGDVAASAAAVQADLGKSPSFVAMISQQKTRFGTALVGMMADPGTKLAVLGALYFSGPDSVIEHLKRRGYKVRRIQ